MTIFKYVFAVWVTFVWLVITIQFTVTPLNTTAQKLAGSDQYVAFKQFHILYLILVAAIQFAYPVVLLFLVRN